MATSKPKTGQTAAQQGKSAALARAAKHPRPKGRQKSDVPDEQSSSPQAASPPMGRKGGHVSRRDSDELTATTDQPILEDSPSHPLRILFEELLARIDGRTTGLEFSVRIKPIPAVAIPPNPEATGASTQRRRTALELASDILQNPGLWLRTPNPQFGDRKPIDLIDTPEEEKVYYLLNAVDQGLY